MLRVEKANVRTFYETFGWSKDSTGTYNDTASFVDLRPVLSSYYHRTQMRVGNYLRPSGQYFLDAGSGPLSQPEYATYSSGYIYRVCVDLSATALRQVESQLGGHALCVIGDLVHLPIRSAVFDAVLASHVLYHIPEDEQLNAILELYRTMKGGATCVIIYMWPSSLITRIAESPLARMVRKSRSQSAASGAAAPAQLLSFQPKGYGWMRSALPSNWRVDVRAWRAVDMTFSRRLVPDGVLGAAILQIMYRVEGRFPRLMARLGRYPMIVIEK
jgi:hypothetical protein